MVIFKGIDDEQKKLGSPRGEIGEVETRLPFQSVKDAVNLFGKVAVSTKTTRPMSPRSSSSEKVVNKEAQLVLARTELNKIKKKIANAETTKDIALCELEKAKATIDDLKVKLTTTKRSKESAIEAAKALKNEAKQVKSAMLEKSVELERTRKDHTATMSEIEAAKEELARMRKEFEAALEAKTTALKAAGEAKEEAELKSERASKMAEEIRALRESRTKAMEEKEERLERATKRLKWLKEEYDDDPEITRKLQAKLAETSAEIEGLQEEMRKAHASEMETVKHVTTELAKAIKTLEEVVEEERFLRNQVVELGIELELVKKAQGKPVEIEVNNEMQNLKLEQLTRETKEARREAEEMSRKAKELKEEAAKARVVTEEVERKLELLEREAEEAKAAEQRAIKEMKMLSNSESRGNHNIILPAKVFNSLCGKVKEYQELVKKTEAASMALVEAIRTRKDETDRKVEANMKEIQRIKVETDVALRDAKKAGNEKLALERVLMRWRQKDQNGEI